VGIFEQEQDGSGATLKTGNRPLRTFHVRTDDVLHRHPACNNYDKSKGRIKLLEIAVNACYRIV
jgi:hypothetical protein